MNFVQKFVVTYYKTIICSVFVTVLSVLPGSSLPKVQSFPNADKMVHFLLYFVLALCFFAERKIGNRTCWATKWVTPTIFPILFGVAMEFLQMFSSGRSASFSDAVANTCGVLVALLVFSLFIRKNHE